MNLECDRKPTSRVYNCIIQRGGRTHSEGSKRPKELGLVSHFPVKRMDTGCVEMLQMPGMNKE